MIKLARILHINDTNVTLKIEQNNRCSDCKSHCGDGFLRFLFHKNKENIVTVDRSNQTQNSCHLNDSGYFFTNNSKRDDVVGIKFDETQLMKLALGLYGLPIVFILISLVLGYMLFPVFHISADMGGFIGTILGLVISKYVIKLNHNKFKPRVEFFK